VTNAMEIQQQGAHARVRGEHMVANPYYKARNMPFSTGESTEEWNQKAVAWRRGWEQENYQLEE
jgi:hypothetical protein